MKGFRGLIVGVGLSCFLSVLPLVGQIANGVDFTTSFPFYAGNTRMPAGTYVITQSDFDENVLLVKSNDSEYSALVEFIPTHAESPHAQTDVTFHKYGDSEYLNRVWVEGQRYGMKVDPTKPNKKLLLPQLP